MKIIKELAERIEDELEGAEDYAKLAHKYRGHHDGLSAMYAEIAGQELTHVDKLHNKAVEIITAWRKEHGDPPRQMEKIWDHQHRKMIEEATEIQHMLKKL